MKVQLSILLWLYALFASAQRGDSSGFYRDYSALYGFRHDILNASENWRSVLKLYSDAFHRDIKHRISGKAIRGVVDFAWTFTGKWFVMLWPHEFGHLIRTEQVGGEFRFKQLRFPGIISSLELPAGASTEQKLLAVIGGFEANHLSAREILLDFYLYDGLYNDEYGMAFGHRILYTLYHYGFAGQNPNDPTTWLELGGDPVNFAYHTWQLGHRNVLEQDSSVNGSLVRFYNQTGLLSLAWNLMDFNFYCQAFAFFGNQIEGKRPFYVGNENYKWAYSTLFNTSLLGTELYLFNFLKVKKRLYTFYFRQGFPYQNQGFGIMTPVYSNPKTSIYFMADYWRQMFYGDGFAACAEVKFHFDKSWFARVQCGYKTEGYLLGRVLESGLIGYVALGYRFFASK